MTNYKQRLLSRIIYIVVSNILNVKYFFFSFSICWVLKGLS